jgi:regulator of cell morphogenesis and NO signaling
MSDERQSLEQLVTESPAAAEIFVRYGLDFCCRGQRSLAFACEEAGLEPERLLGEIAKASVAPKEEESWSARPVPELIDHILERYHEPLRRELPKLIALAERVEAVHADKPSRPAGLTAHLRKVEAAVESHLAKEERILFPLIRAGRGDTAYMPIKVMMEEHEDHGDSLRRTRALTANLVAPEEACASWRELYRGLARLEAELWKHIHLENYVLFPRALGNGGGAAKLA